LIAIPRFQVLGQFFDDLVLSRGIQAAAGEPFANAI
jgi:hypothetical protein